MTARKYFKSRAIIIRTKEFKHYCNVTSRYKCKSG